MNAGLPALVSEWTGAKEVVEQVSKKLIAPLDPTAIAERIHWYFDLSPEEKKAFSEKSKEISKFYTEENSMKHYYNTFCQINADLGIRKKMPEFHT